MARRRNDFDFNVREGRPKYPWDRWMNGETWEAVHGKDFDCAPGSLVVYLYHKAAQLNMTVRTSILRGKGKKPDRVVFQFRKRDAEQPPVSTQSRKLKRK